MSVVVLAAVCTFLSLASFLIGLRLGDARAVARWVKEEMARPKRPPQKIVLVGGPSDGKETVVTQGIEYLKLPVLRNVRAGLMAEPMFDAVTYRRCLSRYEYEEESDA